MTFTVGRPLSTHFGHFTAWTTTTSKSTTEATAPAQRVDHDRDQTRRLPRYCNYGSRDRGGCQNDVSNADIQRCPSEVRHNHNLKPVLAESESGKKEPPLTDP